MKSSVRAEKSKYWREQVKMSGEYSGTLSEYCKGQGIHQPSLQYWRKKLGSELSSPKQMIAVFSKVEVDLPKAALPEARWVAELVLHIFAGLPS